MADIDDTFGALQIGSLFSMFLFGIVTLQCYVYSTRFEDDRKVFKLLVSAVWILELAHTISIAYEVYTATITHYGKADQYTRYPGFGLATIFGGTITMLVQTFFAFRVYTILPSPWRFVGLFCILLTTARCVVSVYAGIKGILATSIAGYTERFRAMLAALLISGAVIDVVVAVSMLWFLIRRRGDAMESAVRLIDKLVVYTVRKSSCLCMWFTNGGLTVCVVGLVRNGTGY
ncbi:hypothetical protein FA15DRAFT_606470 [Coprinopsis marcescibilis]|uniref:Uncharacterized protein n=1 Tax=Coprinopsis marcescibilis TaxID=230819 RepID=A0A5C3KAU6_COPMA|nr:hypothetical protein FA15DRAFT_606470 [Coprinopsis marcescibilis]